MEWLDADVVHTARAGAGTLFSFAFTTRALAVPRDGVLGAPGAGRGEELLRELGAPEALLTLRQVHGNRLESVRPENAGREADGWLFEGPGRPAAAIFVADCLPVALFDRGGGRAALVHCGHRGLSARILEQAVRGLEPADEPLAWLGPCIRTCCYQVQADVADNFVDVPEALSPHPAGGWRLDLQKVAARQLSRLGARVAGAVQECTHCEAERYYSYRRGDREGGRHALVGTLRSAT
jgi:polyphenol oxidase